MSLKIFRNIFVSATNVACVAKRVNILGKMVMSTIISPPQCVLVLPAPNTLRDKLQENWARSLVLCHLSRRKQDRWKRSAGNNGGPLSVLMYNRRTRFLLRRRRIASWAYVFSGLPDFMIDPEPNHKLYRLAHRLADNGKPDKNICWILFQWICLFELSIVFQYEGFAKRMTCKARRWFEKYSAPVPWSRFLHYTLGSVLKRTTAHRILFLSNYKTTTRPGTESLRSSLALNLRVTQSTSWRSHIKLMMDGLFGGFHAEYKRLYSSMRALPSEWRARLAGDLRNILHQFHEVVFCITHLAQY